MQIHLTLYELLKDSLWSISRDIDNILHPHLSGTASGQASIVLDKNSDNLIYTEITNFTQANKVYPSEQKYYYCMNKLGLLEVHTANNYMYTLDANLAGTHICGLDTYKSTYTLDNNKNCFSILHVVIGPQKHYISKSVYLNLHA